MRWMKWAIVLLTVAVMLLGVAVYLLLGANPNGLFTNGDAIAARLFPAAPQRGDEFQPRRGTLDHTPIIWICGHRLKKMMRDTDPALAWCEKGEEFECRKGQVHWEPVPANRYSPPPP